MSSNELLYLGTKAEIFSFNLDKDGSIDLSRSSSKSFGLVAGTKDNITPLGLTW